ncbi:MAG: hypothetical protein EAZ97_13315 [Bacteroidetes bacterium]|nr:MAG: hypothetical protein EAZ97_13315 [Bacteroidota bacterium]
MKLSEIKKILSVSKNLTIKLENGNLVPEHFHITEVGSISKNFIDCGGTVRNEKVVNFQLWEANDTDHRLKPQKLLNIIALSEKKLGIDENLEVEVEYQADTIGKYEMGFQNGNFILLSKQTNCLAKDNCGISDQKTSCAPNSGCC